MASEKLSDSSALPPGHVWFAFGIAAVLRMLPFLLTQLSHPPTVDYFPMGYLPKDWLAYVACIRETAHTGHIAFDNPFTTDLQSGRFILLFHWLLGQISALTHLDPFYVLEFSRVPMLAIFLVVLWRFITPILPDPRHRAWACWLIALSSGVEFFVRLIVKKLPEGVVGRTSLDLWHMFGWNMFESFYNPLWIAALTLLLLTLQPLLKPGGPAPLKEGGWKDALQSGLGFFLLYYSHPYTGVAVVPILAVTFALRLIFSDGGVWSSMLRTGLIFVPGAIAIALISRWQNQDPVFKQSAGGVFGSQELPVFWYPLTYGVLCVFGLLGWQRMIKSAHPWRFALAGWSVAVMLLHSCPLINGYKFAFLLYIPLCIAAAPAVSDAFSALWLNRKPAALALGTLLFAGNLELTWRCLDEVCMPFPNGAMAMPAYVAVCKTLAAEPEGNVMASAALGNAIPACAPDHVFVGQWFMTPQYGQKSNVYEMLVKYLDVPERAADADQSVRQVLIDNRIRYLVIPTRDAAKAQDVLGAAFVRKLDAGFLCIIEVK